MKLKRTIFGFLLAGCLLITAAAKVRQRQRPVQQCEKLPTQAEAGACAHREYESADAELNKAYGQLAAKLDAGERARLKEAELAWIKYRDANCEYESAFYAGGTMRPMIESFCLSRMTRARTAEIREQIRFQQDQ